MVQCWSRNSSRFNSRTAAFLNIYKWLIWNLVANSKLFADDTSLFLVIFDKDLSTKNFNDDLNKTNNCTFQWKRSFNPDPNKQAQEVLFSRKIQKSSQPSLIFNKNIVTQSFTQKYLGMFLDTKLDFQEHLKSIFSKVKKIIGQDNYRSSTTYCRDCLYLQFISPLLYLISTMVTSYMIKHITLRFTKNLTLFNTTQHWL